MDFGDSAFINKLGLQRRRRSRLKPYFDLSEENEQRARESMKFYLPRYMNEMFGIEQEEIEEFSIQSIEHGEGIHQEPIQKEHEDNRVLYVGNLDIRVTEDFVATLFNQIGPVIDIRMIFDAAPEPYALVEFADHYSASQALQTMKKRLLLDKVMDVKWAPKVLVMQKKVDVNRHFHIFVGDLSSDVDSKMLKQAFVMFGEVSEAKIIRDPQTLKSKGYGFVSYPKRAEAERAIEHMNGKWLGKRAIRTNWATRKFNEFPDFRFGGTSSETYAPHTCPSYEDILSLTGPENTTVFVGNIPQNASDDDIRMVFRRFGNVIDIRHFKMHGHSFLKFDSNEAAARAIHDMNGVELMGQVLRCSWGKADCSRNGTPLPSRTNSYHQLPQPYYNIAQ